MLLFRSNGASVCHDMRHSGKVFEMKDPFATVLLSTSAVVLVSLQAAWAL